MLGAFLRKWKKVDVNFLHYLQNAYPRNHTYRLAKGKIYPTLKLAKRYRQIKPLIPSSITRMVDIGCAKGFFVFTLKNIFPHSYCLGVDVNEPDIVICKKVQAYLKETDVSFKKAELHELVAMLHLVGGPFDLTLVLNTYQYLYFGSQDHPECYLNHNLIFQYLRKICKGRIIFNNRLEFNDCQNYIKGFGSHLGQHYSSKLILQAAEKYFKINEVGRVGKYPLLTMDAR